MQLVRAGPHQDVQLARRFDEPGIVLAVQRTVKILCERSADQQTDGERRQPGRNHAEHHTQIEQQRYWQRGDDHGRSDQPPQRSAAERVRPRMMVLEIVNQPLERVDRGHPFAEQSLIFGRLARPFVAEQLVEPRARGTRAIIHVHMNKARGTIRRKPTGDQRNQRQRRKLQRHSRNIARERKQERGEDQLLRMQYAIEPFFRTNRRPACSPVRIASEKGFVAPAPHRATHCLWLSANSCSTSAG